MSLARYVTPAALLVTLTAVAVAPGARAEAVAETVSCQPSQGSLAFVGCSLAHQLALAPGSAGVVVLDLKSDRELPAADQLRERIRAAVATALGEKARSAQA